MYCPECGKFNLEENKNCQYCNAALIDNSGYGSSAEASFTLPKIDLTKLKEIFSKIKLIAIPVLIFVVAVIAFICIGSSITSPEKAVKKYYNAFIDGNYEKMYDYLALPEDDFVSKEGFVSYMTENSEEDIETLKQKKIVVQEIKQDYNDLTSASTNNEKSKLPIKEFKVTFVDKSTGAMDTETVTLIEQDTKTLLFFKNYKISSADVIVQNVKIELIGDAGIAVDGIELENPVKNEDGNSVFKIPAIFSGEHKITLTSDLYEDFEDTLDFDQSNYTETIDVSNVMKFKKSILTSLETTSLNNFKAIYQSALAQKTFPTDSVKLANKLKTIGNYNSLLTKLAPNSNGTGLKSITFKSVKMRQSYYSNDAQYSLSTDKDGNTMISFTATIEYEYSAVVDTGWFETTLETREYSNSTDISFAYTYVNGEWLLSQLSTCILYY